MNKLWLIAIFFLSSVFVFRYIAYMLNLTVFPNCSFVFPSISIYLDKFVNFPESPKVLDIRNMWNGRGKCGKCGKFEFYGLWELCVLPFLGSYKCDSHLIVARAGKIVYLKVFNNLRNCLQRERERERVICFSCDLAYMSVRYIARCIDIYSIYIRYAFGPFGVASEENKHKVANLTLKWPDIYLVGSLKDLPAI